MRRHMLAGSSTDAADDDGSAASTSGREGRWARVATAGEAARFGALSVHQQQTSFATLLVRQLSALVLRPAWQCKECALKRLWQPKVLTVFPNWKPPAAAMKQCLRPHAMTLRPPCSVQQLCDRIRDADAALVGVAGAPPVSVVAAGFPGGPPLAHGILCIGPEGDWTPEELQALLAAGAQPVGLGDLRLRAETAAVALLSYVRMQLAAGPATWALMGCTSGPDFS